MSRLYGSVRGGRGEATRTGHSHITAHVRGWNVGVKVYGKAEGEVDTFEVVATSGSNGSDQFTIGTLSLRKGKLMFKPKAPNL